VELQFHPTPGSKWSQLHKTYHSRCTATCRVVIPIELEFSASVASIHKESVTMHGHTIAKFGVRTTHLTCLNKILTTTKEPIFNKTFLIRH